LKALRLKIGQKYKKIDFSVDSEFVIDSAYVEAAKVIEKVMEAWKIRKIKKGIKEAIARNMTKSKKSKQHLETPIASPKSSV
jgi:hypothetical protein